MINDNEVKATKSPFAMRPNEEKVYDGKTGYSSVNQAVFMVDMGYVNELHFEMLELISTFEFITSRQIYQILVHKGEDIKSQDKLNNKLEQLIKSKILTRYYFMGEEGKCIYRIYCLEKMGKYLLNSRGVECKWQPTDNTKPVAMIKKRLAGNQIIIAYLRKVKAFDKYTVKPSITAKKLGKVFKAHAGIKLTKNGKSIDFIFEAVRREEDWEKKLVDRLQLYKDFYESFVQFDSGFETKPQLIFVCEDEKHMVETLKTIVTNRMEIPGIKTLFTTDLRQNSETLEKSLVEFKIDEATGKYKKEEIDLKLLG